MSKTTLQALQEFRDKLQALSQTKIKTKEIFQDQHAYEEIIECLEQKLQLEQELDTLGKTDQELKENLLLKEAFIHEIESLEATYTKLVEQQYSRHQNASSQHYKNIIMEIRAAVGGEEASLFVSDLMNMYFRYISDKKWKKEIIDCTQSTSGIKSITFSIKSSEAYKQLCLESGVHRVQRVPVTEANGRIHTSTVTVAVLPEPDEISCTIDEKDLEIQYCRSSGAGGQHVNTTDSAVRIVHLPTGIVVSCQNERSQHQNREAAMKVLRAKIFDSMQSKNRKERDAQRQDLIGTGDRSEKCRTYNFPQNRITDHRYSVTMYNLHETLAQGSIDGLLEKIHKARMLENKSTDQD